MANEAARRSQHNHKTNSNLLLPTDTSFNDRRERNENTGEVQSLTNHLKHIRMGDRAQHTQLGPSNKFKKKKDENNSSKSPTSQYQHLSILDDSSDDTLSMKYQPKTQETKEIYEVLLGFIQETIGNQIIRLIQSCVDVSSSNCWLSSALTAMKFSQMITQAMWNKDSYLKQLPYLTNDIIQRCTEKKIETIYNLIEMEDNQRIELLQLNPFQLSDIAYFCNNYPNIEVNYEILDENNLKIGNSINIKIKLEYIDPISRSVIAPLFPQKREEGWWIIIEELKTNILLAIKRLIIQEKN